jgi:hypothetical protein
MEVHAHTHTPRKKWTHFFWEFLMLFLAVFCGFLAEYQLEHKIEKDRGRQFIATLTEDLKRDTTELNNYILFWDERLREVDSLRQYIQPPFKKEHTEKVYYWAARMFYFRDFKYNDRTIQQLRNAGNFRLLRDLSIVDSLVAYDGYIRGQFLNVGIAARDQFLYLTTQQNELLNSFYIKNMNGILGRSADTLSKENFVVQNKPDLIYKYYNDLFNYQWLGAVLRSQARDLNRKATNLVKLIQQKYHLK